MVRVLRGVVFEKEEEGRRMEEGRRGRSRMKTNKFNKRCFRNPRKVDDCPVGSHVQLEDDLANHCGC